MQKMSYAIAVAPFEQEIDEVLGGGFDLLLDEVLLLYHFEVAPEEIDSGVVGHIFEFKEFLLRIVLFGAVAVDISEEPVDLESLHILLLVEMVSRLILLLRVH